MAEKRTNLLAPQAFDGCMQDWQRTIEMSGVRALAEKSGYEATSGVDAIVLEAAGAMTVTGSRDIAVLAPERLAHPVQKERTGDAR